MPSLDDPIARDIATIQAIDQVPLILDVCARVTAMRFCAIARVTDTRWITCASLDQIGFGLRPGDELPLNSTICDEIRQNHTLVVFDDATLDATYCNHHTPRIYGLKSYISVPILLKSGEFFGTLCAIDPEPRRINTPETIGMFQLFADLVAAQIATQDRLDRSSQDLSDERESARLREQFIAVVGHDLRNPIAAMTAGVRMLQRAPGPAKESLILSEMSRTVGRAGAIIEDLLDFARGRLGDGLTPHLRDGVPVGPLIRDIAGEISLVSGEVFRLDCDMGLTLRCDAPQLGRLLSNLLRNAVDHGVSGAPVQVRAMAEGGAFVLTVTNQGPTIPPEILPTLFRPFLRGSASGSEGLGLGLYIADQIARAHGGTLTARSSDGTTTFEFRMPVA